MTLKNRTNKTHWLPENVELRLRLIQILLPLALFLVALFIESYDHLNVHQEGILSRTFLVESMFFAILGPVAVYVALGWFRAQWQQRAEAEAEVQRMYQELLVAQLELERLHALRGKLLQKLISAQEAERARIAREIHDELGQMLTRLDLNLKLWEAHISRSDSTAWHNMEEMAALLQQTQDQAYRMIFELRPSVLDDLGLEAALRDEVKQRLRPLAVSATVRTEGELNCLSDEVSIAVFRIVQESISNVIRHANARHVWIGLHRDSKGLQVFVEDDGVGVPKDVMTRNGGHRPLGLLGMQERAMALDGRIHITPRDPCGTQVSLWVPLSK
ncbi:MAG: sensor histidine kinase [Chloroflexi bacterium]|nr:sensor histidine kinase [Chloroflexota bacterium]